MSKEYSIVIATPLGDREREIEFAVQNWKKRGINPTIVPMRWFDRGQTLGDRLLRLITVVDGEVQKNRDVSLLGLSAGGSAVLNTFIERMGIVNKVITVCARTVPIENWGYRSFKNRTSKAPPFAESINLFWSRRPFIAPEDYKRIMTVRPLFGDQLNPANTMEIPGAINTVILTVGHFTSIAMALTIFSEPLINFIRS